jgi:hypothetical protein
MGLHDMVDRAADHGRHQQRPPRHPRPARRVGGLEPDAIPRPMARIPATARAVLAGAGWIPARAWIPARTRIPATARVVLARAGFVPATARTRILARNRIPATARVVLAGAGFVPARSWRPAPTGSRGLPAVSPAARRSTSRVARRRLGRHQATAHLGGRDAGVGRAGVVMRPPAPVRPPTTSRSSVVPGPSRGSGGLAAGGAVQPAERAIEPAVASARAGFALRVGPLDVGFLAATAVPRASTPAAKAIPVAGYAPEGPAELDDGAHRRDDTGKSPRGRAGRVSDQAADRTRGLPGETPGALWRAWLRRNLKRCYRLGRSRL